LLPKTNRAYVYPNHYDIQVKEPAALARHWVGHE
jgi:hypothetical protein